MDPWQKRSSHTVFMIIYNIYFRDCFFVTLHFSRVSSTVHNRAQPVIKNSVPIIKWTNIFVWFFSEIEILSRIFILKGIDSESFIRVAGTCFIGTGGVFAGGEGLGVPASKASFDDHFIVLLSQNFRAVLVH